MNGYYGQIVALLQGDTDELKPYQDRLDWHGFGAVLALYEWTSGEEREAFIHAMSRIIEEGEQPPMVIAQVIQLASSLDVSQLEPSIHRLDDKPVASDGAVQEAIAKYFAVRHHIAHRGRRPAEYEAPAAR